MRAATGSLRQRRDFFKGRNEVVETLSPERVSPFGLAGPFVQINLNRFTDFGGYCSSAHEAGRRTFTNDEEYTWYGMILKKTGA